LVWLVLLMIGGIITAGFIPNIISAILFLLVALIGVVFTNRGNLLIVFWLMTIFSFGWLNHSISIHQSKFRADLAQQLDHENVSFQGIVRAVNDTDRGKRIEMDNLALNGDSISYAGQISYNIYIDEKISITLSDTLSGAGKFYALEGPRNPGAFDFRSYYHRQGIYGRIYSDDKIPIRLNQNIDRSIGQWLEHLRSQIREIFNVRVGGQPAGLLQALILGDKSEVDPEVRTAFANTGVIHVLAVSGLHVGYVLIILLALARILRIPWGWDRLAVIIGLVFFVALTGGKPSVIRAAIMTGLYILAPVVNRPANVWNLIATAAFLILIINPTFIYDLGFLLSFTAVISIIFFFNLFDQIVPERLRLSNIQNKFLKFTWGLFLVSLSAQIGTLPFTVLFFHRLPLISLVANVIIVPLIGLLVALGFALLFLNWIPFIGYTIGNTLWFLAEIIIHLAKGFSRLPFAAIDVPEPDFMGILIYCAFILSIYLLSLTEKRKLIIIIILTVFTSGIWNWALVRPGLEVIILDVGQGDAIIIKFANRKTMLIDAGLRFRKKDMGKSVVIPTAKYLGIDRFDYVVMTHPHNDHIGGIKTVLETVPVDTVWDTTVDYSSHTYQSILTAIPELGIEYVHPVRGDIYRIDAKTAIQIFAPDSILIPNKHNLNNWSIVFKLIYGQTSFLFTGDLEYEGERLLMTLGKCLDSDVLKVAHHGSITGTTPTFIAAVKPQQAVVSVGKRNKFQHPSLITIRRLERAGANVMRTDLQQAIWMHSDGYKIKVIEWQ